MSLFKDDRIYVIAEIGTSHGGNFDKAKLLIDEAKKAGADCVKFQIVYADEILHPDTGFVKLPTGNIRLYDRFKELEVSISFFEKLKKYCDECSIDFCCSPFGLKSLNELIQLEPAAIKIASPELNYVQLLEEVSLKAEDIPLIISSGVSLLKDIDEALEITKNVKERALLHCVTSYPAPEKDYNLNILKGYENLFGIKCGVSDHSLNPLYVPLASVLCGGSLIEKHITLSKDTLGLDDPVALIPSDFLEMVDVLRKTEKMSFEEKTEFVKETVGEDLLKDILGNGKKQLAKSEEMNYSRTNRSIHFMKDMKKGDVIREDDVKVLRTEKVLSVGLHPRFLNNVIGCKLSENVKNGEGVLWNHILSKS